MIGTETTRQESDHLGTVDIPAEALYGVNTWRGAQNLAFSGCPLQEEPEFATAFAQCKLAAAYANRDHGVISERVAGAIARTCEELISGQHRQWLVVDIMEGSGGTSTNMNFNEVIANRAQQHLGGSLGKYDLVHPNDHVNRSQSTNDVYPSAMKIAVHGKLGVLAEEIEQLAKSLDAKALEFGDVLHLGRTCMQDAQPMYLGQAFGGYASLTRRLAASLRQVQLQLLDLPLGGTAIGTGLGSPPGYKSTVFSHLSTMTGVPFQPAENPFDAMQNMDVFSRVSAELRTAATSMAKIASDLIVQSSGPVGGLGEVMLPAVQAGSSIMPGKVNPVVAMGMVQVGFAIVGNDVCVAQAIQAGQLEINHFEPAVLSRVSDSISLLQRGARLFREKCIGGLQANAHRNETLALESSAIATAFIPQFGYDAVAAKVHQAVTEGRSFIGLMAQQGLINEKDSRELVRQAAKVVPTRN
ncbi:aspartate ammonia-lyase [Variovorax terrae]|uniref:Aspartate ammonia-lyase n=1 Tax=Variovorax terrae TaxID=2923278 RepID=A0A9X1VUG9_9BURK|nr:aspartate ammonia-lyase [Variovorax terrae]MCJ0764041.1 aspartate ammonia-lyase [Variovorax terrae]